MDRIQFKAPGIFGRVLQKSSCGVKPLRVLSLAHSLGTEDALIP